MAWRTLAEPTYGVSEFGQAALLPAGTEIERVSGLIKQGPPGTIVVLVETNDPVRDAWYVTASALRFEDASLGERLGFQPIRSRTHGYNGQGHR